VLLDVHRAELVLAHQVFAHQDGILIVSTLPRHEGTQHVLAQGQLAHLGRRGVGDHVTRLDVGALAHYRPLIDTGRLVGAVVLAQVIRHLLAVLILDHDAAG